jgi:hypothetical protein
MQPIPKELTMAKRTVVEADGTGRDARQTRVLADLAWLELAAPTAFSKCLALLAELAARQIK